ncbi:hypothetical protein [Brachybacterium hainanense]|uniref:Uncharacterized protein n=1 Tax=Brachybacterium hainanense TaxID=1541174 RepID=A0ABV6RC06_9MICO
MERPIDFSRDRSMLCAACHHRFRVDLDWIDRWEQGGEKCSGCGLTCEHEDAPRVTVDLDDPALDDGQVARFAWYHTSTHADWPTEDFDPAAVLTPVTRRRMGGDEHVAAWAARQRAKALHVGTYEAAIHNMLRRIANQADSRSEFHLYRVRLRPDVVVRESWVVDPSDWLGDVVLADVCPPGVDVTRYLNRREDPGGISLALGRDAIASVQQVSLPLPLDGPDHWASRAVAALESASAAPVPTEDILGRSRPGPSRRSAVASELAADLAARLPVNLRLQVESAAAFRDGDDPEKWARRASGLLGLIEAPERVLAALDAAELRLVSAVAS